MTSSKMASRKNNVLKNNISDAVDQKKPVFFNATNTQKKVAFIDNFDEWVCVVWEVLGLSFLGSSVENRK